MFWEVIFVYEVYRYHVRVCYTQTLSVCELQTRNLLFLASCSEYIGQYITAIKLSLTYQFQPLQETVLLKGLTIQQCITKQLCCGTCYHSNRRSQYVRLPFVKQILISGMNLDTPIFVTNPLQCLKNSLEQVEISSQLE